MIEPPLLKHTMPQTLFGCHEQKYHSVGCDLICLFWLMFAVYFCPGCSATGNHSSKSSCINIVNIHAVAAAVISTVFHAQCCMS